MFKKIRNFINHLDFVEKIDPSSLDSDLGAGVVHKQKKYHTHTRLSINQSALVTFTNSQKLFLAFSFIFLLLSILLNLKATAIVIFGALTLIYIIDFIFTLLIVGKSLVKNIELDISTKELASIDESTLPIYTILCPLYKEATVLPEFIENISQLDWPKDRLDVQLLLEEDDEETLKAAKSIDLPEGFRVVIVPDSQPRTKPKACNYGLAMAIGEYVVIYDAEDKPDPLQLKKAYLAFQKLGEKVFCLQSKLNYYNSHQNLLTRLFSAEYSLWFDLILPGLQAIEATIPLGGTSNHFRANQLRQLHAWDPFNVTEDCDLGVRIFKEGYKTAIINSTTYEEANSRPKNWLRQRSRWIKGYMQTYLVHMRSPLSFVRSHGIQAFIFQLIIGMRMVFILVNPILWLMTIAYFALYSLVGPTISSLYPSLILYLAVTSLIFGNFVYLYNYMIACAQRESWELIKYIFLAPVYWLMSSVAAVIAFYQLITKPHYWEKTNHGLHQQTDHFSLTPNFAYASAFMLIATTFLINFINFGYSMLLERSLGFEEFGLISFFGGVLTLVSLLTTALSSTVTHKIAFDYGRYKAYSRHFISKLSHRITLISLFITLTWAILVPTLSYQFKANSILPFIIFTPVWLLTFSRLVDMGFLSGVHKFGKLAAVFLIEAFVKILITVYLLSINQPQLIYLAIPGSLFISMFLLSLIARSARHKISENTSHENMGFPAGFFASNFLSSVSVAMFLTVDLVLAKYFLSPVDAGKYAILSLVGKMVYFAGSSFFQFIIPFVARIKGEDRETKVAARLLIGLSALASFTGFVLFGIFANITIPFIFGEKSLTVISYLPLYTFGISCLTVAIALSIYYQTLKDYFYTVVLFIMSLMQLVILVLFARNIATFSLIISISAIITLLMISLTALFRSKLTIILSNLEDLFGLLSSNDVPKIENKNLKILMFNWRDIKHTWHGGAEVYVQEIAKQWVKKGNSVTLFSGNDGSQLRNEIVDGINTVRRGGFYTVYLWAALYYLRSFRNQYDIVVESCNGMPFFTPFYSRKPKILIIHHVHQEVFRNHLRWPLSFVARFLESKMMPFFYKGVKIVTVSDSSKSAINELGLNNQGQISIVPPGVNGHFKVLEKYQNPTYLYIGRLKHYKRVDLLVRAYSLVIAKFPNSRLIIAGSGEAEKEITRLVESLGLSENVQIMGSVSEEVKVRELAKSWIALQPSSFEGWGITVIESNASRTPVIAANVPGLKDSVIDGETGILVNSATPEAFASEMLRLTQDWKLRDLLSQRAYNWSKEFTWEKSAAVFLNIIYEELNKRYYRLKSLYELDTNN